MAATDIQWTDRVWNPVRGCSLVSAGCTNCYAMRQAHRFSGYGQPYDGLTRITSRGPVWAGEARFVPGKLDEPLRWRKPSRVFVNSMSDLFHDDITNEQIAAVFGVMAACPQHTFQVLTKRPQRMRRWFNSLPMAPRWGLAGIADEMTGGKIQGFAHSEHWPLLNVWIGVSCEDQAAADERIPLLLQCPAAVRWVSAEPLLGPIDFDDINGEDVLGDGEWNGTIDGEPLGKPTPGIDWVVIGGESGPGARPCNVEWVMSVVHQCSEAGTACFVKQLGSRPVPLVTRLGSKGGDPSDWPEDLRVREWPKPCATGKGGE